MRSLWMNLNEAEQEAVRATKAFLNGRLEDQATVDWALRPGSYDNVKRLAILDLIDSSEGRRITEPWRSAWRLLEESWNHASAEKRNSPNIYDVQDRLRTGDRSGSLVAAIVALVAPRLGIKPFFKSDLPVLKRSVRPQKAKDLFSMFLTSGNVVDPGLLELEHLADVSFLVSLAHALDSAVINGLDVAKRCGWSGEGSLWRLGWLNRVYYVPNSERADGDNEPDEFHQGIAPSVKLLYAVVSRLVCIDISAANEFASRFKLTNSQVYLRLLAALSRDIRLASSKDVGTLLLSLDDRCFWDLHNYPEIAELRAKRFNNLDHHDQTQLTSRIRKHPPRNQFPKRADSKRVRTARLYCAVRELRRITIAGATLPKNDEVWLDANISQFSHLVQMTRLDQDFPDSVKAYAVPPNPDSRYDLLVGEERLKALEAALSSTHGGWDDDPARRAVDWIRQPGNSSKLLVDLYSIPNGGATFIEVWNRFGWTHSSDVQQSECAEKRDLSMETARVLALLSKLPETTVHKAIDGISHWISVWEKQIVSLPEGFQVWFKLWPIAIKVTNAEQPDVEEVSLNTVAQFSDDRELMNLDTYNTPTGKLVGVFLAACPNRQANPHPFEVGSELRNMRDLIVSVNGRSRLIALHRLIDFLPYFLHADPDWTHENLIKPLKVDNLEAIALWRTIARQIQFSDILKIIGETMVERTLDLRLGRKTQRSLAFSLAIECLHSFQEKREPAVPYPCIRQMIRSLDDDGRAFVAKAVRDFVHTISEPHEAKHAPPSPEEVFLTAATPFLQQVWPQERSLATPGTSRALANLPATARESFTDAVDAIDRFLMPFECWALHDYGIYNGGERTFKLSNIDNPGKAMAFLRLLDLTIGTSAESVIPRGLADALEQIRKIAPNLEENQAFRRLATAARPL